MASGKRSKKGKDRITDLNDNERRQLYKRASRMRKASSGQENRRPKHAQHTRDKIPEADSEDADEQPPTLEKRRRRHQGSLRDWAETLLEDEGGAPPEGTPVREPDAIALVLSATAGGCQVLVEEGAAEGELVTCVLAPEIAAYQRTDLAVGDRVELIDVAPDAAARADAPPVVTGVMTRRTTLSRPDSGPGGQWIERVIAANVDRVVIVAATDSPPLRTRLLDRYLIAIEHGGAEAAIAITKTDLIDPIDGESMRALGQKLAPYDALGIPIVLCSNVDGRGVDLLGELLAGQTAVLVGQSGVGKSSLLNALAPELHIDTKTVGTAHKGRHTTTASTLYRLPAGANIIDTPGIREFGLWQMTLPELRAYYHEFDDASQRCRFRDCTHLHEPSCAVREGAGHGEIPQRRYESYCRLAASLS